MFVAVDEENKVVYGPFDSQEEGESWTRDYIRKFETTWNPGVDLTTDFDVSNYLWNVQEVAFVDADDRTFEAFAPVINAPSLAVTDYEVPFVQGGDGFETIAGHIESTAKPDDDFRCDECFGLFVGEPDKVEVFNQETGQRGTVHVSCYEANDDVLVLA